MLPTFGGDIGAIIDARPGVLGATAASLGGGVGGGAENTCCAVGLDAAAFCKRENTLGSSSSLALEISGLMTRYASLEKNRTL